MKIINESKKENLPIEFITSFVSRSWDNIGQLKGELEAIKAEFKGVSKVCELIQALIDANLVCIGQMEKILADKDFGPVGDQPELKEELTLKESIESAVQVEDISSDTSEEETFEELKDDQPVENFEYFCDFEEPDLSQPKLTDAELYPEN